MDISRHGDTITLTFADDEREAVSQLALAAQPVIETRCSAADKQALIDQGVEVATTGSLDADPAGYERLRSIARVALTTPHVPTRERLFHPGNTAALAAIQQLQDAALEP